VPTSVRWGALDPYVADHEVPAFGLCVRAALREMRGSARGTSFASPWTSGAAAYQGICLPCCDVEPIHTGTARPCSRLLEKQSAQVVVQGQCGQNDEQPDPYALSQFQAMSRGRAACHNLDRIVQQVPAVEHWTGKQVQHARLIDTSARKLA